MTVEDARREQVAALGELCTSVHELQSVLERVSGQVGALGDTFGRVERGMDAVTVPLLSAVFDFQRAQEGAHREQQQQQQR